MYQKELVLGRLAGYEVLVEFLDVLFNPLLDFGYEYLVASLLLQLLMLCKERCFKN